jgi:hypothetical protein
MEPAGAGEVITIITLSTTDPEVLDILHQEIEATVLKADMEIVLAEETHQLTEVEVLLATEVELTPVELQQLVREIIIPVEIQLVLIEVILPVEILEMCPEQVLPLTQREVTLHQELHHQHPQEEVVLDQAAAVAGVVHLEEEEVEAAAAAVAVEDNLQNLSFKTLIINSLL